MLSQRNQIQDIRFLLLLLIITLTFLSAVASRRLNDPTISEIVPASLSSINSFPISADILQDVIISKTDTTASNTNRTSIKDYIQLMRRERDEMVLLKWDSSGVLENATDPIFPKHLDWIRPFLSGDFKYTAPSAYGKVALVFVCDVIKFLPWDTVPPVPVLLYTTYRKRLGSKNLHLVPNPYDQSGFSESQVSKVLATIESSKSMMYTYETFRRRKNTLMWRGTNHREKIRANLIALVQSEEKWLLAERTSSAMVNASLSSIATNVWLDAKYSHGKDAESMSASDLASMYKYHLDVGGVSGTSWEGLRWKMCSGNLVFHVEAGAMDWWHNDILPGVHYLEVKDDMSNLKDQYDWAESHPREAYEMSQRGREACLRTYSKKYAQEVAKNIIYNLKDATLEDVQEADQMLEEFYGAKNQ